MTDRTRVQPVSRAKVLGGLLLVLATLAGVMLLTELLRHPPTILPVEEPPDAADVRDAVLCPEPAHVALAPTTATSNELYACPHTYDGQAVVYEGEVVGALLRRDAGVWTQLNDDAYAGDLGPLPAHRDFRGGNAGIGVLLPHDLADRVARVGGPDARGDVLTVTGIYHLSDAASGEVAIIRVTAGAVTAAGSPITHDPLPDRRIAGGILAAGAALLLLAERLAASRRG